MKRRADYDRHFLNSVESIGVFECLRHGILVRDDDGHIRFANGDMYYPPSAPSVAAPGTLRKWGAWVRETPVFPGMWGNLELPDVNTVGMHVVDCPICMEQKPVMRDKVHIYDGDGSFHCEYVPNRYDGVFYCCGNSVCLDCYAEIKQTSGACPWCRKRMIGANAVISNTRRAQVSDVNIANADLNWTIPSNVRNILGRR